MYEVCVNFILMPVHVIVLSELVRAFLWQSCQNVADAAKAVYVPKWLAFFPDFLYLVISTHGSDAHRMLLCLLRSGPGFSLI